MHGQHSRTFAKWGQRNELGIWERSETERMFAYREIEAFYGSAFCKIASYATNHFAFFLEATLL